MESIDDKRDEGTPNEPKQRRKRKRLRATTLSVKIGQPLPSDQHRYKLGWIFTTAEQRRILLAMSDSLLFMRGYGKPPAKIPKTDEILNQTQDDE